MKIFLLFTLAIAFIACNEKGASTSTITSSMPTSNTTTETVSTSTSAVATATNNKATTWVESFKQFRDIVYASDKSKIKEFVKLPMTGDIWYLAKTNEKGGPNTDAKFDATALDKYFNKIFSKDFVNTILKIKTPELEKNKEFTTETVKVGEIDNVAVARYNGKTLTITLEQSYEVTKESEDGDPGEAAILYTFDVENNAIKLSGISMAG